jgi:quercetin dioxygenase-like cupin family protein
MQRILLTMQLRKYRWSPTYEPSEFELIRLLEQRNISAEEWSADAGDSLDVPGDHPGVRMWCAEGSLTLTADGTAISLQSGDALEIPANTAYSIVGGLTGYTCYRALPYSSDLSSS